MKSRPGKVVRSTLPPQLHSDPEHVVIIRQDLQKLLPEWSVDVQDGDLGFEFSAYHPVFDRFIIITPADRLSTSLEIYFNCLVQPIPPKVNFASWNEAYLHLQVILPYYGWIDSNNVES